VVFLNIKVSKNPTIRFHKKQIKSLELDIEQALKEHPLLQSGKFKGKERISKKGNSRIRRILHMPALNMVSFDTGTFPSIYERIYRTSGIKMKAYVAIQRKLLCLLFTLWKKDEIFNPNFKSKLCKTSV